MTKRYGCIALAVGLATLSACGSEAPKPAPPAAAPAPASPPEPRVKIYVTNEMSGDLSVIDGDTQTAIGNFPLGKRPRGIKVSPDGKSLFVALSGSPNAGPGVDPKTLPPPDRNADGIGEIDAATYKVKRIIHAGADPEQLAVSADGTRLYVANEDAAQVSVVDIPSGTVIATAKMGDEPEGVTIRPDGKVVYVTSEDEGAVYAIDTGTNKVLKKVMVGHRPRSIGFLPDGSRAFVSLENDGAIAVVDSKAHRFLHLIQLTGTGKTPKARPMGVLVHPDGSTVYVTTGSFGKLFFVAPNTAKATDVSMEVGQRPWGIGLSPDGKTIYTANGPSNDVSVVDLATKTVVKKIPVGNRPWGIAVVGR